MNRTAHRTSIGLLIFAASLLCAACGDGGRGRGTPGAPTDGGTPTTRGNPGDIRSDAPLPPMTMDTSPLLDQALAACQRVIGAFEGEVLTRCAYSPSTLEIVDGFAALHAEAISARPLPGRGLEAFAVPPAEATRAGDAIELIPCATSPLCMPGEPCPSMNAFALHDLVITLDPLLASFAEGAAYWGTLVEAAGGDPDAVDPAELYTGLGIIYAAHAGGRPWQTIDEATVADLLRNDTFVNEMWSAVTAFLILHEIGHADLGHSVINHTAAAGAQAVLMSEGRMLTPEEEASLEGELRQLKVFTETQADIYSATLLRELGFSSDGPVVLFTGAMSAYLIASGACDAAMSQEQLFDCALAVDPNASHPPLDVRATVLRRIVDDGEDLSDLLLEITPPAE